jgi:S1-C subfamily serine protease
MASFGIVSTTEGTLKRFKRHGGGPRRHQGPHGRRGPGRGFGRGRGHGPWADIGPGIESFIRAEVAMLPGFSGGPLVTANGEVAGLNTSALGRFGGITLPLDLIDSVVESLQKHGRVRRGYLGIGAQSVHLPDSQAELAGQLHGLLIVNVEANGPAGTAGLLVGDILLKVNETSVSTVDDLQETLSSEVVDTEVPVVVLRGGALTTISVMVGDRG